MKKFYHTILFLTALLLNIAATAQEQKLKKANKEYNQLAFSEAMEIYEDVARKGYQSEELFQRLGNSYYFNSRYQEAAKWYAWLMELNPSPNSEYQLRYAQSLLASGDSVLAKKHYDKFLESLDNKGNLGSKITSKNLLEHLSGRYEINTVSAGNSFGIDFGASRTGDKVYFASTKDTAQAFKRISAWDGLTFLDLFEASRNEEGDLTNPEKVKGDVNTRFHESSAVVTKDGKTMYFTRNNTTPLDKKKKQKLQLLKIYRAELKDEKWGNVKELNINGEGFSTAHPVLSPDEQKLYFVSDRPEAVGQTDIFYAKINSDGSLGQVNRLEGDINTPGRESFPFITKDNELYFASDGHYGLGGYDVFYTKLNADGSASKGRVLNVGKPLNTSFDDFAFSIHDKQGFFSSNREGGQGYDDIYRFAETKPIKDLMESVIFGKVTSKETDEELFGVKITISTEKNEVVAELITDENGDYRWEEADVFTSYIIKAEKENFEGDDDFSEAREGEREHDLELTPVNPIGPGGDLADLLDIIIYFDFDKHNIRPDAAVELEKIVAAMKKYPNMKVDIGSHTDSRGNDAYNRDLSDRRAKSSMEYIINQGISRDRLTANGYGESQLVNRCSNGVKCSKEEHQLNRRSEFIVVE